MPLLLPTCKQWIEIAPLRKAQDHNQLKRYSLLILYLNFYGFFFIRKWLILMIHGDLILILIENIKPLNEFALFNSSVDLVGLMPLFLKFVFLSFCSGCLWFLDDGDDGSWIMVTMIMKMIYLVHIIVNISPMVAFFQQTLPQLLRRWILIKILERVWLCGLW